MAEELDERLKRLAAKKAAIDSQMRRLQNQRSKKTKKLETRKLVLTGLAMREWAKHSNDNAAILDREVKAFLTRDDERALFGLPPLAAGIKE